MDAAELLERYTAGQRDFTEAVEFQHVDLSGMDLSGIRLSESYFDYVNLTNANLSGASLRGANIRGESIFKETNMAGIDLSYAGISNSYLAGVNLENADLSHATIISTTLYDVNLFGASLKNTFLHDVRLSSTTLTENQKREARKRGANLVINTGKLEKSDSNIFNHLCTYHSSVPFPSEEEYSTTPFIWQIPGKENICVDDLIKLGNYSVHTRYKITGINEFKYPETNLDEEGNQRYNALLKLLREELIDTKIYWMAEYTDSHDYSPTSFDVYLIGKTKAGSFAGISSPDVFWTDYIDDM
jgi:Pentapeptide repeats (8 copies)/Nuclease A inhibitor-like protein